MIHVKLDNLIKTHSTETNIDSIEFTDHILPFKSFTFNGGEEHIALQESFWVYDNVMIEVSLTNSKKIMQLLMITDALRRNGFQNISLFCPYLPYARQDRVCNKGEALSIKVICDLINSQKYEAVYTLDNHSDVSTALLNNHKEINRTEIIKRVIPNISEYALVSPDAGALKKTYSLSKELGGLPVIECSKKRDVSTGNIIKTEVYTLPSELLKNDKFLIVDDICDGGATFIALSDALKEKGASNIELFVSHGIFSRGLEVFNDKINKVYTTKSFKNQYTDSIGIDFKCEDFE